MIRQKLNIVGYEELEAFLIDLATIVINQLKANSGVKAYIIHLILINNLAHIYPERLNFERWHVLSLKMKILYLLTNSIHESNQVQANQA
jgi:hypothetical protein